MTHPIPQPALNTHIAILGKTGSGKSNAAKTIVEDLMGRGERVAIIDPTGSWWGLRLRGDGRKPSELKPVIFGGLHADMPIAQEHGGAIAEAIGESSTSAIIDVRAFSTSQRTKFFTDFAEGLIAKNTGNLWLVIDEAHLFAPQGRVNDPQSGKMVNATNNLVSLGRGIGLRIIMISQRPQKLHKDSLTQVETMVAMRLISPQDRSAIGDWFGDVGGSYESKATISKLPELKAGQAIVWSPGVGMFEEVQFPLASTLDTGNTSNNHTKMEPIDLSAIAGRLAEVKEQVMANDPVRLRQEIAALKKQLAEKPSQPDEAMLKRYYALGYEAAGVNAFMDYCDHITNSFPNFLHEIMSNTPLRAFEYPEHLLEVADKTQKQQLHRTPNVAIHKTSAIGKTEILSVAVSPSVRKIIHAIQSAYPSGLTIESAAKRAGLSKRSSAFRGYIRDAKASLEIQQRNDGKYVALPEYIMGGAVAPSGIDEWIARLTPSQGNVLRVLHNGAELDRESIADAAGISRTSSGLGTTIKELMSLDLIVKTAGGYCLSPDLK